ncbi:MAG: glycosyltransferase family 4 protein [candidate division WOR-3 bacterium]
MRVLLLADASSFHTLKWFRAYRARGADVLLVSLEPPREELSDVCVFLNPPVASRPFHYILATGRIRALASEFRPDILNAHMATGYGLLAALSSRKARLVVSLWGPDVLESPRRGPLHRAALRFVFRKAHLLQTDARVMDRILAEDFGVPREKMFFMPYGLSPELLETPLPDFRPGPPWKIISHRKLEPLYSPFTVLEALSRLKATGHDFTMTFASGGSLEQAIRDSMARLGIPGEVTGWLPERELHGRIAGSHIFISASLSDSTPVSLLEAMALGVFPVVSDLPAKGEWVVDGLNGFLFNPTCPQDLANKLKACFDNPRIIVRAREINKAMVRERADWERNFDRFLETLESLPPEPLTLSKPTGVLPWSYLR